LAPHSASAASADAALRPGRRGSENTGRDRGGARRHPRARPRAGAARATRSPEPRAGAALLSRGLGDALDLVQAGEALQGLALDLPDPLPSQIQAAADLLERPRVGIVQPVAEDQHAAFTVAQGIERPRECLAAEEDFDLLVRGRRRAGDEVAEDLALLVADRLVQARGRMGRSLDLAGLLDWKACLLGDLFQRRLPPELRPENPFGLVQLLEPLDDVDRHADRPRPVPPGPCGRPTGATPPG